MTYGLLWLCLPAATLGYAIGALMSASGHASQIERMHETHNTALVEAGARLQECTAALEAAQIEHGALALQLAEATAKNATHAQIPTRPRRSGARISTAQPTGSDGETP